MKRVLIFANNNTWLWPCCYCPLTFRFGMQTAQAIGAPKKGRPAFGDITNAAAAARHTVHSEGEVRTYCQYGMLQSMPSTAPGASSTGGSQSDTIKTEHGHLSYQPLFKQSL